MRSMEYRRINFVRRDDSIFAGAIFMSNRETKLECLQRKLFGLPLSKYKFLKQVKVGMILFLFEHEERKLYGVFEATSDGALNIIPDAYRSTGQSYPAQILFKRIWMCKPLCEDEFRSAIEDNYYSPNKFHFGLSYQQVIKLIHLFYSRKINIKQHKGHGIPNKIIEKFENTVADEVRLTETGAYLKCKSDEYGREGKGEDRRRLALPQASLDHPMLYKIPATTTSMQLAVADAGLEPNQVNSSPFSHPQNSYSETLNSQKCSICLSHDHIAFHHFSIENQPSTTSEIEYKPLPLHSSSLHVTNDLSPQTEIVQYDCVSGPQPIQVYEFPDYIPLVEESQQKFVIRESQNSSLENSEYFPSAILNSCIPGACKETSKHFYSADGYSDDELKTYQRVEADEYNAVKSSLYADSDSNRTSVFSRLSRHQKISNHEMSPEPSNGEPSTRLSLYQLLNILSTRKNSWSATEVSKQSMESNNNEQYEFSDFDHSDGHQNKITQIPIQPVGRSEIDQYEGITDSKHVEFTAALDSELSNDVLSGESFELPFYNFRRRNTNQKYELQDDSNKSGDICDSEEKLMQSKKRRIVRPSLYEEINQNVKAEAEVKISSQKKEKTEVDMMSSHANLDYKKGSKVSAIDRFLDSVVPGFLTVRKYEAVGEPLEQNHVTSMDESLDFIPIG